MRVRVSAVYEQAKEILCMKYIYGGKEVYALPGGGVDKDVPFHDAVRDEWKEELGVKVQDLGYRWGSCGKGDWLYFHWKAILLPARIAEYVVVHEIAHLHEPHHTPAFWLRVERAMPDYAQRKAWLAEHGIDVEGI